MSISQNEPSQQSILDSINELIDKGSNNLALEYETNVLKCSCFGLLNSYKSFVNFHMPFQTQAYLPLCLSVLTAILQKSIGYTAHYMFLTAEPNANKTTILDSIQDTIKELDGLKVSQEDPQSYVAFYQQLEATQDIGMMYCRDEIYKSFIHTYIKGKKTTEVYQQFVSVYEKNTFQAPLVKIDKTKPKEEQDERRNLYGIRFSLVGTGTTEELQTLLKAAEFTDGGWVSRMGIFILNQSHNRRSPSKQCEHDENTLPIEPAIFNLLNILNNWGKQEVDLKLRSEVSFLKGASQTKPKRNIVLKFRIPEAETAWSNAQNLLDSELKAICCYFKKTGNSKYFNMFNELSGERTFRKAMYYSRLLFIADAILFNESPMSESLNSYYSHEQPVAHEHRIYLPATYYEMGIHITRLMVANLYKLIKDNLSNEDGTDYSIQKAILKVFYNNQDVFGRCGVDGLGATLGDISRYITNQYRSTLYRQARRDNVEMLCNSGYLEVPNNGKQSRGARYRVTQLAIKSFPDLFKD